MEVDEAVTAGYGPEDLEEHFREVLHLSAALPFCTVLRHVLTQRP